MSNEHREKRRFPIQQDGKFRVLSPDPAAPRGETRTLNLSSSGASFETPAPLPMGSMVELSVNWPAMLYGSCPLKLVLVGRVVRAEEGSSAITIDRYEFRTQRIRPIPAAMPMVFEARA